MEAGATGVGEGSMGRAGCGEMRQAKGGGGVFADPLSGASTPDPPFPRSPAALSRSPPPPPPSTPEARGWFGVERQAARGR